MDTDMPRVRKNSRAWGTNPRALGISPRQLQAKARRLRKEKAPKIEGRRELRSGMRFAVLHRDGFQCQYCGAKAPDVVLHVDHRTPRALGGRSTLENLVTACMDCNLGKGKREL